MMEHGALGIEHRVRILNLSNRRERSLGPVGPTARREHAEKILGLTTKDMKKRLLNRRRPQTAADMNLSRNKERLKP